EDSCYRSRRRGGPARWPRIRYRGRRKSVNGMKICTIVTGYVGLVSGACFAETGQDVVCCDIDEAKIEALEAGRIPIHEVGLEELVARNVAAGRLTFSADVPRAIRESHVVFVAVGTPSREDGGADLSAVDAVAHAVVE